MKKPRRSIDDLLSLVVLAFALLSASALVIDLRAADEASAAAPASDGHIVTAHA
jgi:hypothetical protein